MAKFRNFLAMEFCPKHVVDIKPQRCPFCHIVELEAKLDAVRGLKPFVMADDQTFVVGYDELQQELEH